MEWFEHLLRCRDRRDIRHILVEQDGHSRQVIGRAKVRHHQENLVLIHQFLRCQHGLLRIVLCILHQQLDLAAMDAARLLVEFLNTQQHSISCLLTIGGKRPGQVLNRAQQDFILADALRRHCFLGQGNRAAQGQNGQGDGAFQFHGESPVG